VAAAFARLTTPKSGKVRSVPMAPDVAEALARLARRERFTAADELVFPGVTGGYLDGDALSKRYGRTLQRAALRPLSLAGVIPGQNVSVIAVQPHGSDAVELTYKTVEGELGQRVLGRDAEVNLATADAEARPLDAVAADFKLVAECQRIKLAGLSDPMLAVMTSDIQPLPHQLRAVYGELLPRTPLRFLLADDPGAGKTIMAGLYIKELILREDVKRCLVVVPGGLVDQWQDELYLKFGLAFEILVPQFSETVFGASAFEQHPLLIARMDQLARNEDLLAELSKSEWDLVIVDEAHRMGAQYFAGKLEKTKRFVLGEQLGDIARHLLLMTATPHSGKEDDFQLFLTLLDRDRFEGKYQAKVHTADTSGVMRRMVKEDLLTFDGKPLFPERIVQTVPYELSELEQDLYEQVTTYVREGMDRAAKLDGKRRNTVGFALTILQRRLASSPEAIYRSLQRRADRLERRKQEVLAGGVVAEPGGADVVGNLDEFDEAELSAGELEQIEDELVDAATAARTVKELDAELLELRALIEAAARVRASDTDRKWSELRTILEDNTLATSDTGDERRKLIVFTEHRDTLEYLARRIGSLLGRPEAVQAIHGDRESAYVALSRARERTDIFVSREDLGEQGLDPGAITRLGERMAESHAQQPSITRDEQVPASPAAHVRRPKPEAAAACAAGAGRSSSLDINDDWGGPCP